MMKRTIVRSLEAITTSGIDSEAVHVFCFMLSKPAIAWRLDTLAEKTQVLDIHQDLQILEEAGFVTQTKGKWQVRTSEEPNAVLDDLVDGVSKAQVFLEAYQLERDSANVRRIRKAEYDYALAKFKPLASKLDGLGIPYRDFIHAVNEGFQFMRSKDDTWEFVRPEQLVGKYALTLWERDRGVERRPGHAGHSYDDHRQIRASLAEAGFETAASLTEADLRYIGRHAKTLMATPELVQMPEKFREEIVWVARQMEGQRDAANA